MGVVAVRVAERSWSSSGIFRRFRRTRDAESDSDDRGQTGDSGDGGEEGAHKAGDGSVSQAGASDRPTDTRQADGAG